jgi:hypothetical protein
MSWETSAEDSSELRNAKRDCPGLRQLFLRRSRLTATHESYFYIRFVLYLSLLSPSIVCHLHSIPARCIPETLVHQPPLPSPVVLPLASKLLTLTKYCIPCKNNEFETTNLETCVASNRYYIFEELRSGPQLTHIASHHDVQHESPNQPLPVTISCSGSLLCSHKESHGLQQLSGLVQ